MTRPGSWKPLFSSGAPTDDVAGSRFLLRARVSSSNARAIRPVLEKLSTKGTVKEVGGEFEIEAWMEGPSARE